ncbi:hypothetical protein Daus18300_006909 [Diaporthe australafricana]|uniref:GA4 desaturase n=1 Tax=Diaporthe australafricana TaxID=127596 RepID=A0ABR3WR46_9PEZI
MTAISNHMVEDDAHKEAKPYIWRGPVIPELPISNAKFEEKPLNLTDVRNLAEADKPKVETHGFCFINHESKTVADVHNDNEAAPYVDEMVEFLKDFLGVETVIGFNARTRSTNPEHKVTPVSIEAHIDTNKDNVWGTLSRPLTEDERELVRGGKVRARIFNIWRPRVTHAEDFPLAVCDPNTLDLQNDVIMLDNTTPETLAELSYLRHSPEHKWYWLSNQTPGEVILFTQSDSHPPKGQFRDDFNHVPHGAFRNEAARPGCPQRQSIEARFIVLEPAPYSPPARNPSNRPPSETRDMPYTKYIKAPHALTAEGPAAASKEDRGIRLGSYVAKKVELKSVPVAVKAN